MPLTPGPSEPAALPSPVVSPKASASALRRVLRRARDGVALNVEEAAAANAFAPALKVWTNCSW
ncbi:hypothetical protein, partial [Mycobacterium sp.]|uniref:hypothetical protein n=1 Tax=Mycobacterium sp. TaxID=1785 RepID=UPI00261BAA7E